MKSSQMPEKCLSLNVTKRKERKNTMRYDATPRERNGERGRERRQNSSIIFNNLSPLNSQPCFEFFLFYSLAEIIICSFVVVSSSASMPLVISIFCTHKIHCIRYTPLTSHIVAWTMDFWSSSLFFFFFSSWINIKYEWASWKRRKTNNKRKQTNKLIYHRHHILYIRTIYIYTELINFYV